MSILVVDQISDFSASAISHAGLYTSVSSGLLCLHELRRSASKAANNSAPAMAGGSVAGTPTFNATNMVVGGGNYEQFSSQLVNGANTIAFGLQIKNGGASSDTVVGASSASITASGQVVVQHWNRRVALVAETYPTGNTPPTGAASKTVNLDYAAGDDGAFYLFYATAVDGSALTLYDQKHATSATSSAAGLSFIYTSLPKLQLCPATGGSPSTGTQGLCLFAHWNRELTSNERATFYAEMLQKYATLGLAL